MSYTIEELDEAITDWNGEFGGSWHEFLYRGETWDRESNSYVSRPINIPGIGIATILEDHGGGEGSGEERWFVFSVTDADGGVRTFRRNGYYASFVGSEFDGPTEEVAPVQKTITVWEAL